MFKVEKVLLKGVTGGLQTCQGSTIREEAYIQLVSFLNDQCDYPISQGFSYFECLNYDTLKVHNEGKV